MKEYKEVEMKDALIRYADGERVYYRYFTNVTNGGYSWIGGISLDHLRRNPERYTFYIEEPKKTLWDKGNHEGVPNFWLPDVKEALKEFLEEYTEKELDNLEGTQLSILAKEIFGKELLDDEQVIAEDCFGKEMLE